MAMDEVKKCNHLKLLEYSEEEIKEYNHYELLGLEPNRATPHSIKQAYRKACVRYHPDKTGRGESDYVFIAIKAAWDTLSVPAERQAYDSTVMPFDDSIPPDVNGSGSNFLYTDEDFYGTFGPVFERNLRFDTRLQEAKKKPVKEIPSLGGKETDITKVTEFYDYWTHFSSWRDFSMKASEELFENNNPLEDAESRYEKRFYQKEIDKRAKVLKRQEMNRIQTLVQRAMAADPRLKRHRIQEKIKKERAAMERKEKKEEEERKRKEEEERQKKEEAERLEQERIVKAEQKLQREKEKKQLRKAKQQLRKLTIAAFQEASIDSIHYNSLEGMSDEVEFLCSELSLLELNSVSQSFSQKGQNYVEAFQLIKEKAEQARQINHEQREEETKLASQREEQRLQQEAQRKAELAAAKAWTKEELSALAKAVKKFPGGGANRWDQIANFINNTCRPENPKSKEEAIETYNQIARSGPPGQNGSNHNGSKAEVAPSPGTTAPAPPPAQPEPDVSAPVVSAPAVSAPAVSAPAVSAPVVSAPAVSAPVVSSPVVSAPVVSAPVPPPAPPRKEVAEDQPPVSRKEEAKPPTENSVEAEPTPAPTEASAELDTWTEEQDAQLQDGLAKFPASMEKNERWTNIAKGVTGRSKKQCVQRFKTIREALKSRK